MSQMDISPEDRERLAKTKFGEWFDEFFEKKFSESFEKLFEEKRHPQSQQQTSANTPPSDDAPSQPRPRRRSLLEECFSQTFGM